MLSVDNKTSWLYVYNYKCAFCGYMISFYLYSDCTIDVLDGKRRQKILFVKPDHQ